MNPDLRALYAELLRAHGPQGWWWPGEEPFEIAVGAILVQRSRWEQADVAVTALRARGLLEAVALAATPEEEVRELVRAAGFPSQKPRRLRALAAWWAERAPQVPGLTDAELRAELRGVDGVGEETADAISLYCFGRPAFLCDEYARRALAERGHAVPRSYAAFARALAPSLAEAAFTVAELAELHGLIVEEGKAAALARPRPARPTPGVPVPSGLRPSSRAPRAAAARRPAAR